MSFSENLGENKVVNNKGFSLPGLIVSLAVFVILAAGLWVAVDPATRLNAAKDSRRNQDILVVAQALKDYVRNNQGQLPITGEITTTKKVLCDTATTLTCAGDELECLVVDSSTDFLDSYLATLPVDPEKINSADTGYYLTGDAAGNLLIGSCDYADSEVVFNTQIKVAIATAPSCGGTDFGGYCWYVASATGMTCTEVCSENALTCVADVVEASGDCSLHAAAGLDCTGGCTVADGQPYAPAKLDPDFAGGGHYCFSDAANPAYTCSEVYLYFYRLCACE
ncbi:type II secretion system protein [Candidatus Nomurabacteria bacterium]|nr:type II secretion system protein [Candidatus Nomurabacteria bacterium]